MPVDAEFILDAVEQALEGTVIPTHMTGIFSTTGHLLELHCNTGVPGIEDIRPRLQALGHQWSSIHRLLDPMRPLAPNGMTLRLMPGCLTLQATDTGFSPKDILGMRYLPGGVTTDHGVVEQVLGTMAADMTPGSTALVWDMDQSMHARMERLDAMPGLLDLVEQLAPRESDAFPHGRGARGDLTLHRFGNIAVLRDQNKRLAWMAA